MNQAPALQLQPGSAAATAEIIQEDVNQKLAAVLLLIQSAMEENKELGSHPYLLLAEANLKATIQQLVRLHYTLLENNGQPFR